jgi:DNA topoisomerase I
VNKSVQVDDQAEKFREARLHYCDDAEPGITRRKRGRGFSYHWHDGRRIADPAVLARIKALAVPPAYTDVWISPDSLGFLQATGRDARGRKQYRYHSHWTELREAKKFDKLTDFAQGLPRLRAQIETDLRRRELSHEKVVATVLWLLDKLLFRVGNDSYVRENESYGLTTLRKRHLHIEGARMTFQFVGKSGKKWNLAHTDRRIARVIGDIHELDGQRLFQYLAPDGSLAPVQSDDINHYMREASGRDYSSRQFRTWAATVIAAQELKDAGPAQSAAEARRKLNAALDKVAKRLNNTRAICRGSYVHPDVVSAYLDGALLDELAEIARHTRTSRWMDAGERAVLRWLERSGQASATKSPEPPG